MRALFIHHDEHSGADVVGERLQQRGFELVDHLVAVLADPVSEQPFPDISGFDIVAPTGAIWSVYDHETIGSWIGRELELLREAREKQIPILGICFGAQALATALGGDVFPASEKAIGWYTIESETDEISPGPWFEWHEDTFSLPPGATELARNANGIQAYRTERDLAVQFHPEITASRVREWVEHGGEQVIASLGIHKDELFAESDRKEAAARRNTYRLIDYFLDEVSGLG